VNVWLQTKKKEKAFTSWTLRTASWFGWIWIVFLTILLVGITYSTHGENSDKSTQTRWIKFGGGIIRKETFSIIKGPEDEEDDEIKTYSPNCSSVMKDLIFENEKAIKVPNILQCYDCGELATIYHPSTLSWTTRIHLRKCIWLFSSWGIHKKVEIRMCDLLLKNWRVAFTDAQKPDPANLIKTWAWIHFNLIEYVYNNFVGFCWIRIYSYFQIYPSRKKSLLLLPLVLTQSTYTYFSIILR